MKFVYKALITIGFWFLGSYLWDFELSPRIAASKGVENIPSNSVNIALAALAVVLLYYFVRTEINQRRVHD